MASLVWLIGFFVLFFLNVPIMVALVLSAFFPIVFIIEQNPIITISFVFESMNSAGLLSAPLFLVLGKLMLAGKTSQVLFDFANSLVGWMRGGAGAVNVVTSMIFGGMSGSAVADIASTGPLEMEMMEKRGYDTTYAAGITAATAVCSPIIPPSVIMIVYALTAQVSTIQMLLSGLIPGILMGLIFMAINHYMSVKHNWQPPSKIEIREILQHFRHGFFALMAPIVLIGGMLSGWFTPSEVGFVAVAYVIFLEVVIFKSWGNPLQQISRSCIDAMTNSGVIMMIICNAAMGGFILSYDNVPILVKDYILSVTTNPFWVMLIISATCVLLACFLEIIAIIVIAVPVFYSLGLSVGIDPVSFGLIVILSCATGYITPPLGMTMYALATVRPDLKIMQIARGAFPFLLGMIALIFFYLIYPEFVLVIFKFMG
jgi:tripartite ATP-independent transporter DctM subunit